MNPEANTAEAPVEPVTEAPVAEPTPENAAAC